MTKPTIVCLCGSTRFSEAFQQANLDETLAGRIILTIGCDMRSDSEMFGHLAESEIEKIKADLDELHKRKIDLADEVLILNVGGYIGQSTRSELDYAIDHGKTIRFLEPDKVDPEIINQIDSGLIDHLRCAQCGGDLSYLRLPNLTIQLGSNEFCSELCAERWMDDNPPLPNGIDDRQVRFGDIVEIIKAELVWTETDGKAMLVNHEITQEYHNGYISGLRQAIHLIGSLLGTDDYLRLHGYDPEKVGAYFQRVVNEAIRKAQAQDDNSVS